MLTHRPILCSIFYIAIAMNNFIKINVNDDIGKNKVGVA